MSTALSFLSSQNSLFSTIITFYTLILLYFPSLFLQILSSPIPISTIILILSLLRLGQSQYSIESIQIHHLQQPQQQQQEVEEEEVPTQHEPEHEPTRCYNDTFVEWNVRAPLEIIYEEHEEGDDVLGGKNAIEKYASLSLYYPESDSDGSSEGDFSATGWDSPEKCFRWDEEYDYDKDGLIEIELDDDDDQRSNEDEEEDNLIEIDLFPAWWRGLSSCYTR